VGAFEILTLSHLVTCCGNIAAYWTAQVLTMARHVVFVLWTLTLAVSVSADHVFRETFVDQSCGDKIDALLSENTSIPLVDQNGIPTNDRSNAWGKLALHSDRTR